MKRILVADLFGTLIPGDYGEIYNIYKDYIQDKEFKGKEGFLIDKMLLRCIELGGSSCFIVQNLYCDSNFNLRNVINEYVYSNFSIDNPKGAFVFKEEIYRKLYCGELELLDLVNNNLFNRIKEEYNISKRFSLRDDRTDLINDISIISKISLYPSFQKFLTDNIYSFHNRRYN